MSEGARARRRGREERVRARETARRERRLPPLRRRLQPFEVLAPEELERIHDASMRILEEVGVAFRDPTALSDWRRYGAKVVDDKVFLDRHMVMELVGKAPAEFDMASRNPDRRITIGGPYTVFAPMQGAPHVRDLDGVRRQSTLADLDIFSKLTQMLPCMHIAGGFTCEANDLPVPWRHLDFVASNLLWTDLPTFGATTSRERAEDTVSMARILHGAEFMDRDATLIGHISGNSPLLWDETMLDAARVYAKSGQVVLMSPFVLASANTPADIPATLAQLNAEALAGISYVQSIAPGTRTIYGQYMASISLRTGAPMAGTPELPLMVFAVGQLARKYGLPWRTTGSQASSKLFDAQSGYESAPGMMAGILAGANLMLHCGGWDEAGLTNCMAKFVVDAEQNELYHRLGRGIDFESFEGACEAIRAVTPGGHYLGAEFTLAHFEDAFAMPTLMDFLSEQQWQAEGSKDLPTRARERVREMLASYEAPALDPSRKEALEDFMERRKRQIDPSLR